MTHRIFLLFLSFLMAGAVWATPKEENEYTRLARLSYIEGHVSYQQATDVDWAAASINLPLEPGDRIYTSPDGRAEIEFDDGSVYRLARNTDVEILSLKEDLIQLRILVGLSTLIVSSDMDFEIDTPAAAFNTLGKGVYRFNVDENGDGDAIVRKGSLEAANNSFSRRIESGEMLHITLTDIGNPDFVRYERRDEWDEWNDRRNADLNAYNGWKYLPDTAYIGASDLDQYGHWVDDDSYGSAWVPYSVDTYWSPYSVGRWCYRPLYGWTWISYEPWGWLPYHYGRWHHSSVYGWCWLPGPAFGFNFWSPGLVAFYSGPGWISWCPLGPGDYYNVNHYHFKRGIYGYQLSKLLSLQTRAQGNLLHRDVPGAFRTVLIDQFRNGSFGGRNNGNAWTNIDQPWKRGQLVADSLSIRPTAMSYRAVPDRQAAQPERIRSLPAVIRNIPAYDSRSQAHFTRITNPQIPSLPSITERRQSAQDESRIGARTNVRVIQAPARERANPGAQNPSVNSPVEQDSSRTTTPRWSGTYWDNRKNTDTRESVTPAGRSDANAPATRQSIPRWRSEQAIPEQRQVPRTPIETKPNQPESRPNNYVEPRSRTNEGRSSDIPATVIAPRTNSSPTYYAPRQSSPSSERNSGARSLPTPVYNQSGGGNSSRSNGGEQKPQDSGSSGGGRNHR